MTLQQSFDTSSKVFSEMSDRLEQLKQQYGERSKLYITLKHQFDTLVEMQDLAAKEITSLNNALHLATVNQRAQDLLINSLASRIPTQTLLQLLHE